MAFPNIFKANTKKQPAFAPKEKAAAGKEKPAAAPLHAREGKKISFGGVSSKILLSPHITEKASLSAQNNQYIFKVHSESTKYAVAEAVKEAFDVDAVKVNVITIPSKEKRVGRTIGTKAGYKKAIITLKKGQAIEIMPR